MRPDPANTSAAGVAVLPAIAVTGATATGDLPIQNQQARSLADVMADDPSVSGGHGAS